MSRRQPLVFWVAIWVELAIVVGWVSWFLAVQQP